MHFFISSSDAAVFLRTFKLLSFFALSALKAETEHQFHLNDSPLSAVFGHIAANFSI